MKMIMVLFALALTISIQPANVSTTTYRTMTRIDVALKVICDLWETRNLNKPDEFIGPAGEVGRCAVRITTAKQRGFKGTGAELLPEKVNRSVAEDVLIDCRRRGNRTAYRLFICYNSGPRSKSVRTQYAKQLATIFAHEWLQLQREKISAEKSQRESSHEVSASTAQVNRVRHR